MHIYMNPCPRPWLTEKMLHLVQINESLEKLLVRCAYLVNHSQSYFDEYKPLDADKECL